MLHVCLKIKCEKELWSNEVTWWSSEPAHDYDWYTMKQLWFVIAITVCEGGDLDRAFIYCMWPSVSKWQCGTQWPGYACLRICVCVKGWHMSLPTLWPYARVFCVCSVTHFCTHHRMCIHTNVRIIECFCSVLLSVRSSDVSTSSVMSSSACSLFCLPKKLIPFLHRNIQLYLLVCNAQVCVIFIETTPYHIPVAGMQWQVWRTKPRRMRYLVCQFLNNIFIYWKKNIPDC